MLTTKNTALHNSILSGLIHMSEEGKGVFIKTNIVVHFLFLVAIKEPMFCSVLFERDKHQNSTKEPNPCDERLWLVQTCW